MRDAATPPPIDIDAPAAYVNRELSFLSFAGRVLALGASADVPLLERVKFIGIVGMLHDEFFMKRMSGIKRRIKKGVDRVSIDGRQPAEELEACRHAILQQTDRLSRLVRRGIRPDLKRAHLPILDYRSVSKTARRHLREYFQASVMPILTPLAVDAEHPFPFVSNLGVNLAIVEPGRRLHKRFVRLKVPSNRPRWVPLPNGKGWVPLEQIIAANLDLLLPDADTLETYLFRVTRGAEGDREEDVGDDDPDAVPTPGSIIRQVASELKARRFAGAVRIQVSADMPATLRRWLTEQLNGTPDDLYPTDTLLGLADLLALEVENRPELHDPPHTPLTHPRLQALDPDRPSEIFEEIRRGDLLLHHPYHSFETSVVTFLRAAASDPQVLAIKLTIYRTSSDSPIAQALADAARSGKQVAVLVEVTARFDEAPNIAWGQLLEKEGVHVSYGVRRLKTHVKLALVVREEEGAIRRYAHVGTGNYHSGTARIYEDLGLLTSTNEALTGDVATVFNHLTGATPPGDYRELVLAPSGMRARFVELIRAEAERAARGQPSGIYAKMNQLEDVDIIRELYAANRAGVPITLNVRGVCRLRPGVPGLSENIRLYGVLGRFLEHSRIYRFQNGGDPAYYIGSLDWMRRNLDSRVETLVPIRDEAVKRQLAGIIDVYERDNYSAWDCGPDGTYTRRTPAEGEKARAAQDVFIRMASRGRL